MKCPKCGSENARIEDKLDEFTVYHCNKCNEYFKVDEPSIAEMLLWLAENESIDIWHTATKGIIYVWRNGNAVKFDDKTLTEAIKQAYDWAKQEVGR